PRPGVPSGRYAATRAQEGLFCLVIADTPGPFAPRAGTLRGPPTWGGSRDPFHRVACGMAVTNSPTSPRPGARTRGDAKARHSWLWLLDDPRPGLARGPARGTPPVGRSERGLARAGEARGRARGDERRPGGRDRGAEEQAGSGRGGAGRARRRA